MQCSCRALLDPPETCTRRQQRETGKELKRKARGPRLREHLNAISIDDRRFLPTDAQNLPIALRQIRHVRRPETLPLGGSECAKLAIGGLPKKSLRVFALCADFYRKSLFVVGEAT